MENRGLHALAVLVASVIAMLCGCDRQGATPSTAPSAATRPAREVRVAAAADLKFALDEVAEKFRASHPDVALSITYGSSGNFYTQLSSDAPFDLYLSADVSYPQKLVEQGKARADTLFRYAVGRIVVWVPSESKVDVQSLGIRAVGESSLQKVAIANPQHAPYGRAAEAAMRSAGVYDQAKGKLVLGENVAQAAQFVQSGSADVGVIALSLAVAPPMRGKGRYAEVPLDAYPRIEQGGVVLSNAKDPAAADDLRQFLLGPDGKAILKAYGFADAPQ